MSHSLQQFLEMTSKMLLYHAIEVLTWVSLLMLSIGLGLFVKDIWNDFQAGKTNDRVYSESIDYFRHPTIAICFEPQINETKLKEQYNKTIDDINVENSSEGMKDMTVPVQTLLDEVRFKLGRDFSLYLVLSGHESNDDYKYISINNTSILDKISIVLVEEIPSIHYGTCTILRISEKLKGSIKLVNFVRIHFQSEDENELPLVNFFFTSEKNIFGAIMRQWMEGEVYALAIDPKLKLDYAVNLRPQRKKRLKETSYCSSDLDYYKCIAEKYAIKIDCILLKHLFEIPLLLGLWICSKMEM